jgi:hypothetical protein
MASRGSPGNTDPFRSRAWARKRELIFAQAGDVELDGVTDQPPHFRQRTARGTHPWQIRYVRTVASHSPLDDDEIIHGGHLRPAFFIMLFNVPGGTSADGWPATVTRPCFAGCVNWRWDPSTATSRHPSSCSNRSTSLIVTGGCLPASARATTP